MKFHDGELYDYIYRFKKTKSKCIIPYDTLKNIIITGPEASGKYSNVLYCEKV